MPKIWRFYAVFLIRPNRAWPKHQEFVRKWLRVSAMKMGIPEVAILLKNGDDPAADPFAFMLLCLAGWMSRNQPDVIEYLPEEARSLGGLSTCQPFTGLRSVQRVQ